MGILELETPQKKAPQEFPDPEIQIDETTKITSDILQTAKFTITGTADDGSYYDLLDTDDSTWYGTNSIGTNSVIVKWDFDSIIPLEQLYILWRCSKQAGGGSCLYKLEYSEDDSSYTTLINQTTSSAITESTFQDKTMRYLKLTMSSVGWGGAGAGSYTYILKALKEE